MTAQAPEDEDILETARSTPEAVDVEAVVSLFDSDQGQARNVALMSLNHVADHDPDMVVEYTDEIIERLDDDFPVAGSSAAQVLSRISPHYPERVMPALPTLIEKLDEHPPLTGFRAGRALAPLLEHDPEAFHPYTDDLINLLAAPPDPGIPEGEELMEMEDEKREKIEEILEARGNDARHDIYRCYGIQEIAAHALVEISEDDPDAVVDRIGDIQRGLEADPTVVQGATLDIIANVGQDHPGAVEHLIDEIVEKAQSGPTNVRAHAVQTLGFVGATEAVESLRAVAESDAPEVTDDLADLAAETADFLEAEA